MLCDINKVLSFNWAKIFFLKHCRATETRAKCAQNTQKRARTPCSTFTSLWTARGKKAPPWEFVKTFQQTERAVKESETQSNRHSSLNTYLKEKLFALIVIDV